MPNYLANRCFNSLSEMSAFAVDSTDEDGLGPFIVPVNATSYKVLVWRKNSVATIDNETVYTANGPGRWIALSLESEGGGSLVTVSDTPPSTVQPSGSTHVWAENNANQPHDSVITYVSNGTAWIESQPRIRTYGGTPDSLGLSPNSERELWLDTTTGLLYNAFNGGWIQVGSGGGSS